MAAFIRGVNDLATWCKENNRNDILSEYDDCLNAVRPEDIMFGSNTKVWWRCNNNHSYEAPVCDRTKRGRQCLFCSNRRVLRGYNDLETAHPDLVPEWDFERNKDIVLPNDVTEINNTEVWWRCEKGHSYKTRISRRTMNGNGCPYCSGHRVLPGFNDLSTVLPKIVVWWDNEKNSIGPADVTTGSGVVVWWRCSKCGESYRRSIVNQVGKPALCPKCGIEKRSKKRVGSIVANRGSLLASGLPLLEEWDYDENEKLGVFPNSITSGSDKKVWWRCVKCSNRWIASVSSRTRGKGSGCPKCGKEYAPRIRYENMLAARKSLADSGSDVLREWDYEKNEGITPADVLASSGKSYWWFCQTCGHSWKARVYNRTRGIGCPNCSKERSSSFPEQAILFYLTKVFPDSINRDMSFGKELDIYIPSEKTAVEYDGVAFHKNANKDYEKGKWCESKGIQLFRIRELGCPGLLCDDKTISYTYKYADWDSLGRIISDIVALLGKTIDDIDIFRDQTQIYSEFITKRKANSLQELFPEIAKEWDYSRNGKVLPSMVLGGSERRFWWRCERGHEYNTAVAARTTSGRGCPFCAKQRLLVGFNDFATCYPLIAKEWDYEKNDGLKPQNVIGGAKKIWWKCPNGHSYQATMNSRTNSGTGCPYCSGHKAIVGVTDLFTVRPELMHEWDELKNEGIDPHKLKRGSGKRVWWICPKGHSYDATIVQRLKSNCPICAGKRVLLGFNDLASQEPQLVKEWDYEKNTILPTQVTRKSSRRVWWKCDKGHSFQVGISDRVLSSTNCPVCCNKKILNGYNDLFTTHPNVAAEWNVDKNSGLLPNMVGAGSARKAWWKCCSCGNEWQASIASRTKLGHGCPKCGIARSAKAKLKRIINLDTGEVFEGVKMAKLKYPTGNIVKCIHGGSKTAGGFRWAYVSVKPTD